MHTNRWLCDTVFTLCTAILGNVFISIFISTWISIIVVVVVVSGCSPTYMHRSWLLWNLLHTFRRVRLHIYYACCAFPHPKHRQQLLLLLLFRNRWTNQTTIKCHCILNNRKTCSWIHPHTQSTVWAAFCIGLPALKTENLIEIYGGRKFH